MCADPIQRGEDTPRTLIFADMLGFAELTRRNPTRVVDFGPDERGFVGSGTTDLQTRVVRFQRILDVTLNDQALLGGVSAMIFSDCAYIDVATSLRASSVAIDLIRLFITADVPVRMGLGRGTFYDFKHSVDVSSPNIITKALFAGTAVVNAHSAEQCGAKGCRILVHSSVEADLKSSGSGQRLMAVPSQAKSVGSEICYLPRDHQKWERDERLNRVRYVDQDLLIVRHIKTMAAESEPIDDEVRLQYDETLAAIDRMRKAVGRGTSLEEAQMTEDEQINEENAIADSQGD